jgi:peptidyl-prolyl cis-trans isomerase SurA
MRQGLVPRGLTVAALLLWGAAAPLLGQRQVGDTVERVIAVVGYTPILSSEIDEEIFARFPQGKGLPDTPDGMKALRRQMLQELIDLELLFQRAQSDTTVKVTEEQVNAAVDEQVRNVRQKYPSDKEFRDDLKVSGFQTPEEYRRWLTDKQRRQLVTNMFVEHLKSGGEKDSKLKPVIPTDKEMRAYSEEQKGQQTRPETISFRQIVIAPQPTAEAKARARALADSILIGLRKGDDFAAAAKRFSMDPGSREQGGSLGWFRRGVMHPAFEQVAFNLRPGFISDPVETPFGYHLIQVERVQPAEVSARHVLIMPDIRQQDADSARALAERVRDAISNGASFDSLQRKLNDPLEERDIKDFPTDKLLPAYGVALKGFGDKALPPVFRLESPDPVRAKWVVVEIRELKAAGDYKYEDVKDAIRGKLGEQLALRRYIDKLRAATYVEIRGP